MSNLSHRLKEFIEERGLTQKEVELATGIKRSNISEFLSETHTPSFKNFVALLYYFNCSADYLLGLVDIPTDQPLHEVPPFGKRLRAILEERGLAQATVMDDLHISTSVMYKWLSGKSEPCTDSLIRLSTYLECSVDYLIGRVR